MNNHAPSISRLKSKNKIGKRRCLRGIDCSIHFRFKEIFPINNIIYNLLKEKALRKSL